MSGNNGGSRIAIPGQMALGIDRIDAPFATPVQFNLQTPGSLQAKVFGGFTKIEMAVLQIAGAYKNDPASDVVTRAEEILEACAAREAVKNAAAQEAAEKSEQEKKAGEGGESAGGIILP